jgi:hypothetical protein
MKITTPKKISNTNSSSHMNILFLKQITQICAKPDGLCVPHVCIHYVKIIDVT